ncbi:MAG: cell division protein FtsZ [Treponema sp.]|nr:cell division protein FtsZ [Treponema sp.]
MDFEVINEQGSNLSNENPTVIKVVGCGGGGSNAVNRMIEANIQNVEFIALNTDLQALNKSIASKRLAIGQKLTQGLGCGGDPSIGEKAAEEDKEAITNILRGANMVFVTAGMGGGTGTGSAPVVAKIARELGALTVGIVTTPFTWEGKRRMELAQDGLKKLQEAVDSVIIIPNRKICEVFGDGLTFVEQYRAADDLLRQSIEGMSTIITKYGTPNIDFADVRAAMQGQGTAIFGIGVAKGENRAVDAAQMAINNPLLEDTNIDGAKHFLINVCANNDFKLNELEEISGIVCASASKDYELKPGIVVDETMGDSISVTVIATGFNGSGSQEEEVKVETVVEKKSQDTNVISASDFDSLLSGSKNDVTSDTPGLFDSLEEETVNKQENPNAYVSSFTKVRSAVDSNVDENDVNTPACLRRKRELRRDITFNRK